MQYLMVLERKTDMMKIWEATEVMDVHVEKMCKTFFSVHPKDIDQGALAQIGNLRRLPFALSLAILPDVHQGYGMPIGGVLGTDVRVVIPNAVGVDIGCGMQAVKTNILWKDVTHAMLLELNKRIRALVPVGFNVHKKPVHAKNMPEAGPPWSRVSPHWDRAKVSMGTLGGNNHFIEAQKGSDGHLWFMVHTGSRNLGKQICDGYNNMAKKLNAEFHSQVDPAWDLAFLPDSHSGYGEYLEDMGFCIQFAAANRMTIMDNVLMALQFALGHKHPVPAEQECHENQMERIDICHNHASIENHMGKNMMVHRKGAAGPLRQHGYGIYGIIPGSKGESSFIVKPKKTSAMVMAMDTTSHGAGRPMSRGDAKRSLSIEAEEKKMEGIVHSGCTKDNLDEAPGAYKDITEVMQNQEELCSVVVHLLPMLNIKDK